MNADHRSLETVFSIAICRRRRQTAVENSVSSDLESTFVDSINVFDCILSEMFNYIGLLNTYPKQSETMATRNNLQSGNKRQ